MPWQCSSCPPPLHCHTIPRSESFLESKRFRSAIAPSLISPERSCASTGGHGHRWGQPLPSMSTIITTIIIIIVVVSLAALQRAFFSLMIALVSYHKYKEEEASSNHSVWSPHKNVSFEFSSLSLLKLFLFWFAKVRPIQQLTFTKKKPRFLKGQFPLALL